MMQDWSPGSIEFLHAAAARSNYYRLLAEKIAPYLPQNAHVCDAGCGLGELSLALLPHCAQVTAIDAAAAPIADLRRRAAGIGRLEILQGDILENRPEKRYDAMVFCLFGHLEETLQIAAEQCSGPVILIKRAYAAHRFSVGASDLEHLTPKDAERELERLGIPCRAERFALELGQPLRSLEEAERFFRLYNRGGELDREEIRRRLQTREDAEFPYYLPNRKRLGLLAFHSDDVRKARGDGG